MKERNKLSIVKKFRVLSTYDLKRPEYEYDSGKGRGCYRTAPHFEDFHSLEEAEAEINTSDYWDSNLEDLMIVPVYISE